MSMRRQEVRKKSVFVTLGTKAVLGFALLAGMVLTLFYLAFKADIQGLIRDSTQNLFSDQVVEHNVGDFVSSVQNSQPRPSELSESEISLEPLGNIFENFSISFLDKKDPLQRLQETNQILSRAHSNALLQKIENEEIRFFKETKWSSSFEIKFLKQVIPVLGGEVASITWKRMVSQTELTEKNRQAPAQVMPIALQLRCLGASMDQQETPAEGTLVFANGKQRTFTLPTKGQLTRLILEKDEALPLQLAWNRKSPGVLLLEGMEIPSTNEHSNRLQTVTKRTASLKNESGNFLKKTLKIFIINIDNEQKTEQNAKDILPETYQALRKRYLNNLAEFKKVIAESANLAENAKSLLTNSPTHNEPISLGALEPFAYKTSLFLDATGLKKKSVFSQIAPDRKENFVTLLDSKEPIWGEPTLNVLFPQGAALEATIKNAVNFAKSMNSQLQVYLINPDYDALSPSLRTFFKTKVLEKPRYFFDALRYSFSQSWGQSSKLQEHLMQIDRALAAEIHISQPDLQSFAIFGLRRHILPTEKNVLQDFEQSFAWIASGHWENEESSNPRLLSLSRFQGLLNALLADSTDAVEEWKQRAREVENHAIISSEKGEWHLFPFGHIYLAYTKDEDDLLQSKSHWNVPRAKVRDAEVTLLGSQLSQGQRGINFYFLPQSWEGNFSLNFTWNLKAKFCQKRTQNTEAFALAQHRFNSNNSFELTFKIKPSKKPFWVYCVFDYGPSTRNTVEVHLSKNNKPMDSKMMGLGEYGFALKDGVDNVPGVVKSDIFYEQIRSWAPPAIAFLPSTPLRIWSEPHTFFAFSAEEQIPIQFADPSAEKN